MKNHRALNNGKHTDLTMKKYYIITKPTRLSDLTLDDLDDNDFSWHERSRQLQARRWKKMRNQIA